MGVARIPVGQGVSAFNLLGVQRGVSSRLYTHFSQLTQPNTTGLSAVDDGTLAGTIISPKISFNAGGSAGGGPAEIAEAVEMFNQDPFISAAEPLSRGDVYFGLPIYASGYFMLEFQTNLVAGSYFGLTIGGIVGSGIIGATGAQVSFHIRYDIATDHWHCIVSNKWAAVGHKLFDVDLGTSATNGIFKPLTSLGCHLEIFYMPNQFVDFFVDSNLVLRFTDATHGNMLNVGDHPLLDIYNNRASIGSTVKGIGAYTTTGPVTALQQNRCSVCDLKTSVFGLV